MDLKVVGTMGLTDDDIQALKELPETDTVEGAYSTDVICGETDSQKVLHVESLNKEVNHLSITEGRLPKRAGSASWIPRLRQARNIRSETRLLSDSQETLNF